MNVISSQVDVLTQLLRVANLRHAVIAQNVANVNTPQYRQLDVSFEEAFARALAGSGEAAVLRVAPQVVEGEGGPERADGNNVDVDLEMGRLAKNTLLFRTFAQVLSVNLATARSAISGR